MTKNYQNLKLKKPGRSTKKLKAQNKKSQNKNLNQNPNFQQFNAQLLNLTIQHKLTYVVIKLNIDK